MAVENIFKGKWVEVRVYAPTYDLPRICTGFVYCLEGRRLLDHLNGAFPGTRPENSDFLSVKEISMYSLRGETKTTQFACLNKANILFVREINEGETRGLGSKSGSKRYPYVLKSAIAVKLYLPFFSLTGHIHYAKGERVSDVLNASLRFVPFTNVEISSSVGSSESGIGFVAVNKEQIIFLEELGETLATSEASQ